ncbi:transcriptional regulator [Solibacillus sp. R5-41]|uniref:ROK family protein n=1 Tax=Solibacillus sp. R5-41 TaxID=2048654 RepID=UPI000C125ACC|nr:ROK family protein [Solibacillus sp. R5-41]ATP41960.1 transcriptional regulator [Solibacillus sp. R5-41]
MWILSGDIGGTKLALAISKVEEPEKLVKQIEVKSPQQSDALFKAMIDGFQSMLENELGDVTKVSVGLPGVLDIEKGLVIYQQNLPWRQFPLVDKLQAHYPNVEIKMETDMTTAANGEYKIRHFQKETMIYMTISTGIACCTIHDGKILRGAGIPGEVGFSLTREGEYLEWMGSGPALQKMMQEKTGDDATLEQFFERYYKNDPLIMPVIQTWQEEVAHKIHTFLMLLDPHVIVLGGGVMNHHPQMVKEIAEKVDAYFTLPFFEHKKGRIQASINKGNAGLIGAALF